MTIKLLMLGALCAFLGSQWEKGGTSQATAAACEADGQPCPLFVAGNASPERMFAALANH